MSVKCQVLAHLNIRHIFNSADMDKSLIYQTSNIMLIIL